MILLLAVVLKLFFPGFPENEPSQDSVSADGELLISIKNLKNTKGQVGILVFSKEEGFPSERSKAIRDILVPISGKSMTYSFPDLPFGEYAVSVMHDENNNRKLDTNFFGIPKEGNGVSNNAVGKMGPPRYNKAAFQFHTSKQAIQISLRY